MVGTAVAIVEDAVLVEDDEKPVEAFDDDSPEDDAPVAVVCRVDDPPRDEETPELTEGIAVAVPMALEEVPLILVTVPVVVPVAVPVVVPLALVKVLLEVPVGDERDEGIGDENDPDMPVSAKSGE